MNKSTLPRTLHGLLAAAISDARNLCRSDYFPNYAYWHRPNDDGRCEICLAGSLIAGSLQYNRNYKVIVHMLDEELYAKVDALNSMRIGDFVKAYSALYHRKPSPRTQDRLQLLPVPASPKFMGWHQYDAHLISLDAIVPLLRAIEEPQHA